MTTPLQFPFAEDKLYQLKLFAMGRGYDRGRRDNPLDIDFHEDDLGRILCNVYALAEGPYLFDSRQENTARCTARVALEYARAYNAGRLSNGNKTLSFDALVKSVPMSMSIAASAEEYEAVLQELHHVDKRGEASVILSSKDELPED